MQRQVDALGAPRDPLAEAVRRNTEMLEQLLTRISDSATRPTRPQRRRPLVGKCWRCGQQGHYQRDGQHTLEQQKSFHYFGITTTHLQSGINPHWLEPTFLLEFFFH